ncbi:sulfurtransferase complex subunit TusC [Microbulbifer guangxiensis]|uniref:sulfurtransferase complex subunit TusC n=1 Tax=Microbulbifer guangxiensis TaxID=2904249 RepID=UPI001F27179F|nr:sulfurtransferase complex subunit TusC [Microbulbifer guangxiensis]
MSQITLAICRHAPYGNALAREGLEAVLAAAAMDQTPDVLFTGDGIFQLLPDQAAGEIDQKSLHRNLQALPMFGVEQIYVCQRSLEERAVSSNRLAIAGINLVLVQDTGGLISRYQHVLSF